MTIEIIPNRMIKHPAPAIIPNRSLPGVDIYLVLCVTLFLDLRNVICICKTIPMCEVRDFRPTAFHGQAQSIWKCGSHLTTLASDG